MGSLLTRDFFLMLAMNLQPPVIWQTVEVFSNILKLLIKY